MLYEIPSKVRELQLMMSNSEHDSENMIENMQAAFADLMNDQAEGAETAMRLIRNEEAFIAGLSVEIVRLKEILSTRKARVDNAKDGVRKSMILTDTTLIETTIGSFHIRKGSERTVVHDEARLIELCVENEELEGTVKIEVIKKPVLKEVKKAIKSGLISEDVASLQRGDPTISVK